MRRVRSRPPRADRGVPDPRSRSDRTPRPKSNPFVPTVSPSGMDFSLPTTVGVLVALVAAGTAGLIASSVMPTNVVLMMVTPSMLAFAAVCAVIGVKHGEYRATAR